MDSAKCMLQNDGNQNHSVAWDITIGAGRKEKSTCNSDRIIFVTRGEISCYIPNAGSVKCGEGHFFLIPGKVTAAVSASRTSHITCFYLQNLLINDSLSRLTCAYEADFADRTPSISLMHTHPRIKQILESGRDVYNDGVACNHYDELKIREFLCLLPKYYSRDEVYRLLFSALNSDLHFCGYVRLNWHRYKNVAELSEAMNMTAKQFSNKFKALFGQTAYKWIKNNKAQLIFHEIIHSDKPIKEIAYEYGFGSLAQFSNFVKKELDDTPNNLRKRLQR